MYKNRIIVILVLFMISGHVFSNALTWLNPPGVDIGLEGDYTDSNPIISSNGRFVAFSSFSSNLVLGDTNPEQDIYLKDLQTNSTILINTNDNGEQFIPGSSYGFSNPTDDGKYIAISSSDDNMPHRPASAEFFNYTLYIKDTQSGAIHTPLFNSEAIEVGNYDAVVLSDNGRYLYFSTEVGLLVNDINDSSDVYIYDRVNTSFELVSIGGDGNAAGQSELISISNNERYVNFRSTGDVLPATIGLSGEYGYIRDLDFSTTTLYTVDKLGMPASTSNGGLAASDVSNNGLVYFCSGNENIVESDDNGLADFFMYNEGTVSLFPFPNVNSPITDYSCGYSRSNVFVNNDDTKFYFRHQSNQIDTSFNSGDSSYKNIFVNLSTQQSTVINQLNDEILTVNATLSASDNLSGVVFTSTATMNDIDSTQYKAFHYSIPNDEFKLISNAAFSPETQNDSVHYASISDDQNWVAYATEADNVLESTNTFSTRDLYLLNRATSDLSRIGYRVQQYVDMSPSGRYVVFRSFYAQGTTPILLDSYYLFLYDNSNQSYTLIASEAQDPRVNDDGNVVFWSGNSSLVVNDNNDSYDVFLYVKSSSTIQRISVNTSGNDANDSSSEADIGGSGTSTWIVFESNASDLITSDINDVNDIFMVNWPNGQISRISEISGIGGDNYSIFPRISTNTTTVSFVTYADNLVGDANGELQVMAYDRVSDSLTHVSKDYLGNISDESSYVAIPSSTGRYIAFNTEAALLSGDNSIDRDVYVYDLMQSQMTRMTQYDNGDDYNDTSVLLDFVVDDSQSPALLGALFNNHSFLINDYFNLNIGETIIKPLYLIQSGGDGNEVHLDIIGNGTVTGNLGFNCTDSCTQIYVLGQTVTLIAEADNGSTFSHWQGGLCDNSTELSCEVYVNGDKSIQAVFNSDNDIIFSHGFEN